MTEENGGREIIRDIRMNAYAMSLMVFKIDVAKREIMQCRSRYERSPELKLENLAELEKDLWELSHELKKLELMISQDIIRMKTDALPVKTITEAYEEMKEARDGENDT